MTRPYPMVFEDDPDMHYVDLCPSISFSFPLQLPISVPVPFTLTFTDHPICIVSSPNLPKPIFSLDMCEKSDFSGVRPEFGCAFGVNGMSRARLGDGAVDGEMFDPRPDPGPA